MRLFLLFLSVLPRLWGQESPAARIGEHRAAASEWARRGQWRLAETRQREALAVCARESCSPEALATLRGELAGYLVYGGFAYAAIPLWKRNLESLGPASPLTIPSQIGLGVALHAAGRPREAEQVWRAACPAQTQPTPQNAACRFNLAASHSPGGDAWTEMEYLLPAVLDGAGALTRATALIQTAAAALFAGHPERAAALAAAADAVLVRELHPEHPYRAVVHRVRAQIAQRQGDGKQAKLWRKKAEQLPDRERWESGTVSVEELRRRPQ